MEDDNEEKKMSVTEYMDKAEKEPKSVETKSVEAKANEAKPTDDIISKIDVDDIQLIDEEMNPEQKEEQPVQPEPKQLSQASAVSAKKIKKVTIQDS